MNRWLKNVAVTVIGLVALMALVWAAWNEMAAKELASALSAMKAAGLATSVSAMNRPDVPPEENAALIYLAASDAMHGVAEFEADENLFADGLPTEAARVALPRYFEVLALLRRASHLTRCAFPQPASLADSPGFQVADWLQIGRLLVTDARARLNDGDRAGAEEDLNALFALGRAVGGERTLIAKLALFALQGIGTAAARDVIRTAPDPLATQSRLNVSEIHGAIAEGVRTDLAITATRIEADPSAGNVDAFTGNGTEDPSVLETMHDVLTRPLFRSNCASYFESGIRQCRLFEEPYSTAIPRLQAEILEATSARKRLSRSYVVNSAPFLAREAAACADVRLLQLGARALDYKRSHGDWPKALAEIGTDAATIDPGSDLPFQMRRDGDALVLASPSEPALTWRL